MTEYVTQKTWKILVPFLVAIMSAGMHLWWQAGLQPVFAQSLDQINVSLSVFDAKNEAVNGTFQVRFAIYNADRTLASSSDASGKIWEETKQVEVRNGIIRTSLGDTNVLPAGLFSDVSRDYFLGVRIDQDSEMIPRKKISSVPSALNALTASDAASLGGKVVGTKSGDIPVLGSGGKVDINLLPTGTGTKQLVLGNDGRLHGQNTDTGTDATSFVVGSSVGLGTSNFDLSVSNASSKPTLRFDSSANVWKLSNDGSSFSQILTGSSGAFLALSGGTMTGDIAFNAGQTFGGATLSELGYLSGSTGNIQSQLDAKAGATHVHAAGDITSGTFDVVRGGTGHSAYVVGDILYASGTATLSTLPVGVEGECLVVSGGIPVWGACSGLGGSLHGLLSATHSDTATGIVSRGALITGQGVSAKWTALSLGAIGEVLRSNGTDALWAQLTGSDVGLGSVENVALSTWGGSANLATVGTVTSGTWSGSTIGATHGGTGLTSSGAAGNILRSDGTGWTSWTPTYLTSFSEADTLATVTGRGATTAVASSFTGGATIRSLT
ncbi:MAG: hypothetical protein HGA31_03530, partial [Candidatus Moranbacteria bacterium]|nr:hypothetical protein [Candidatus Moranbacteria bacterium]